MAKLIGINEICRHLGVSESTAMGMIQQDGLPAKRNKECIWESDTAAIDKRQSPPKKKAGKPIAKGGGNRVNPDEN